MTQLSNKELQKIALRSALEKREWEMRRAATMKSAAAGRKTSGQLGLAMKGMFHQVAKPGAHSEENMAGAKLLKAFRKGFAGRACVIGNTVFNFDKDGICRVIDQGNARLDYEVFCRMNGVVPLTDDEQPVVPAASIPVAAVGPAPMATEESVLSGILDDEEVVLTAEEAAAETAADGPPEVIIPPVPVEAPATVVDAPKKSSSKKNPR